MEFVRPGTDYPFVDWARKAGIGSAVMVGLFLLLIIVGSVVDGLPFSPRFGVDFAGGTEIQLSAPDKEIGEVRAGLTSIGLSDESVQSYGSVGAGQYLIRIRDVNFAADQNLDDLRQTMERAFGSTYGEVQPLSEENPGRVSVRLDRPLADLTWLATDGTELNGHRAIEAALQPLGSDIDVRVSRTEHNTVDISLPGLLSTVTETLSSALGEGSFEVLRVDSVGPRVGAELRQRGILSIVAALALILVYVAFRFELSFAPGAVVALFHDVVFTIGLFLLIQREFNLSIIAALLTIVGYSLNDTIVVYDRIRENIKRYKGEDLRTIVNRSLNQTLSRTVLTSVTTLIAVAFLLALGGPIILDFALAMLIGVIIGTYSSIFVASPLTLVLNRWLPVNMDPEAPEVELEGDGAVV